MRNTVLVVASFALFACTKSAPSPAPAAEPQLAAIAIRGKVTEKIDAAQYSYLKLQTAGGETWTAVPRTDEEVGAEVAVVNAVWMQNFKSNTLGRTWERIAFGTLDDSAKASASQHPTPVAAADLGKIKVAKASGPSGRTVAEIWTQRTALKDRNVAVRGKVVKATNGVMGKNWLHLRDGTGEGPSSDLAVASDDTAAVGDTVLVTGVVHLDKDLGAGYHYDVIVENARIKAE